MQQQHERHDQYLRLRRRMFELAEFYTRSERATIREVAKALVFCETWNKSGDETTLIQREEPDLGPVTEALRGILPSDIVASLESIRDKRLTQYTLTKLANNVYEGGRQNGWTPERRAQFDTIAASAEQLEDEVAGLFAQLDEQLTQLTT